MASVVVVTRNPALAMGLRRHGYDVSDVRPDAHGDWTRKARWADAVVLELSDAVAAEAAVQRLRAEGLGVPVLLAANATPGWETTARHLGPGARVLPLPLSLAVLAGAVEELLAAGPVDVPPPPANEDELLASVAASVGLSIGPSGALVSDGTKRDPVAPPAREGADRDPVADGTGDGGDSGDEEEPAVPVGALVAALVPRVGELVTVADAAARVASVLAAHVAAEAVTVLLPGGEVAAGPPVEVAGAPALLGPVNGWMHALAVPVPGVGGVLVAARNGPAYDDDALATAGAVAAEAAPLLGAAVAARALARALAPYAG